VHDPRSRHRDAEPGPEQAFARPAARRRRPDVGSLFAGLSAQEFLVLLSEADLADLDDVAPSLRVLRGGRR
jgi:hypothetical protein